ncbi:hypothetical protein VFPPC_12236 [Pochonia chlamydosporia 170]|uniref:Tse2 ADP-ribosyltransferase toxin domain-containing protein n=1 Tax=Pochonia chlamydosporia 170 TaxID=1380566 RepID=A0A179EZE0_METCM|nr:hypothetical protein VFPPC_12236 [Pochonia chlamydosporia 170]OAQ58269.1 hypothetical protein VFPPC_12236 [Pochonia chlamydosporia 170]
MFLNSTRWNGKQCHCRLGTMANLIGVFKNFPKELFRINNGHHIQLRQWSPKRHAFDVCINKGMVQAKALQPHLYQGKPPNGASMRPNSPYQQQLVARLFKGKNVIIYAVPPGKLFLWTPHLICGHAPSIIVPTS